MNTACQERLSTMAVIKAAAADVTGMESLIPKPARQVTKSH